MVPILSPPMSGHVDSQFRKDPSGRLVFLPFGSRGKAYFVDSQSDEENIKSFLKKYRTRTALIHIVISPIIYGSGAIMLSFAPRIPLHDKLEIYMEICALLVLLIAYIGWRSWSLYKEKIEILVAPLNEVGPDERKQLREISSPARRSQQIALACMLAALVLACAAIIGLTRYSRPNRDCPPKSASSNWTPRR